MSFNAAQSAVNSASTQSMASARQAQQTALTEAQRFARQQGATTGPRARGVLGVIGRVVVFVLWLAVVAFVVAVGFVVLRAIDPSLVTDVQNVVRR